MEQAKKLNQKDKDKAREEFQRQEALQKEARQIVLYVAPQMDDLYIAAMVDKRNGCHVKFLGTKKDFAGATEDLLKFRELMHEVTKPLDTSDIIKKTSTKKQRVEKLVNYFVHSNSFIDPGFLKNCRLELAEGQELKDLYNAYVLAYKRHGIVQFTKYIDYITRIEK